MGPRVSLLGLLSFEAPGTPMVFTEEWKPTVDLHVGTEANPVEGDMHEIVPAVNAEIRRRKG